MARVFHRIQVIEIPKELIEAVHCWQELVQVAKVVLAELASGITHGLEHRGNGGRFVGHAQFGASLTHSG